MDDKAITQFLHEIRKEDRALVKDVTNNIAELAQMRSEYKKWKLFIWPATVVVALSLILCTIYIGGQMNINFKGLTISSCKQQNVNLPNDLPHS